MPSVRAVSHETDVLYVQVPEDMRGGRLNIWPIGADDGELAESLTVVPAENKVLRFRGDALHQVLKHQSPLLHANRR